MVTNKNRENTLKNDDYKKKKNRIECKIQENSKSPYPIIQCECNPLNK